MTATTTFKKPIGVYIIAVMFLLAPLGNILISFAGSGISNWYQPDIFFTFLASVPWIDWLWLALLFVTGLLLFRPHKLTWTLAMISLAIVLSINALRLIQADKNSIDPTFLKVFSGLAILCTIALLVITAYFRFPYLDRRSQWFSKSENPDRRNSSRNEQSDRRHKN